MFICFYIVCKAHVFSLMTLTWKKNGVSSKFSVCRLCVFQCWRIVATVDG